MKIWNFFKNNAFLKNGLLAIAVTMVLIIASLLFLNAYTQHGVAVEVPDVKGLQINQALPFFDRNSLRCEINDSVYRPNAAPGSIVETNPEAGAQVKKNRKIYVTINAFTAQTIVLPDVKNQSQRQAMSTLIANGLKNISVEFVSGPYKDLVVGLKYKGTDIKAGERVPVDGRYILLVSSGIDAVQPDTVVTQGSPEESWF